MRTRFQPEAVAKVARQTTCKLRAVERPGIEEGRFSHRIDNVLLLA